MGIITLTDRISVSVRAKNETERNSQKRATGKNIANALGNANISDDLADQIGNTSKPTIADEQGREWVSMSDIIAAGKKMQQEGVFDEKKSYRYGNVTCVPITATGGPVLLYKHPNNADFDAYGYGPIYISGEYTYYIDANETKDSNKRDAKIACVKDISIPDKPYYKIITDNSYSIRGLMIVTATNAYYSYTGSITYGGGYSDSFTPMNIPVTEVGNRYNSLTAYGDLHEETSGGSLIDWTKPDDEIEEDIRNLHETWDVSDHAGSVNANGTYVLAGPIEFNPGD